MTKIATLLLICLAIALGASDAEAFQRSTADLDVQAPSFQQQADRIRADLSGSDQYAEISPENRAKVLALLTGMESMLDSSDSVDALPPQTKVDLFNSQEQINTILTGARADSRMVCRREATTGSHRKQQNCMTVAERERRRQRDHEYIRGEAQWTPCLGAGGRSGQCVGP